MGGPDAEREVSLASGAAVAAALSASGWHVASHVIDRPTAGDIAAMEGDVFFPVLHGPWGEGGPLQVLLEQDGRPFVGSSAGAAAMCMDKARVKHAARKLGIRTPDWDLVGVDREPRLDPPAVVKPNDEGSSIDLHQCDTRDAVLRAAASVAARRGSALVESWITGRELTVGLLAGEPLPIVEIVPADGCYDYEAKYTRTDTRYRLTPHLPGEAASRMRDAAELLCTALGVRDVARVDFLLDEAGWWMLEVNTMPGFTRHSLLPMAADAAGLGMPEVCHRLATLAASRGSTSPTGVSRGD
jgi:D-alanine-D-alanine ligase